MMRNLYQISVDPGMTGVGFAVWKNLRFSSVATLKPKGKDHLAKLMSLQVQLNAFYLGVLSQPESSIETIVIESWERFIPKFKVATMMKSAEGRGVLIAVSMCYCQDIRFISKGKTKKGEAQMVAEHAGITGSAHAKDAYHLGMLAGFFK